MPSRSIQWSAERLAPHAGLGPHRDAWAQLNHSLADSHAMLDPDFVDPLLEQFDTRGALLVRGVRDGTTVALALLHPKPRGLGVWRSFQPSQAQIGLYLLPTDMDVGALFNALSGLRFELDLLCNDPLVGDLRHLESNRVQAMPHALTMNISLKGGFDDYWAQRSRKLIQNMRRYARRLQTEAEEAGQDVRFVALQAPEDLRAALARYANLEGSGWKGRQGTAVRLDNAQGRFYEAILSAFAQRGEAIAYELWLGQDLLASRLVLLRGRQAVMLKTAFSEAHERFAPGRVMLMRVLEDLFQRAEGGVVEFYTDADADLLAWSTGQRWIHHVSVYPSSTVALAMQAARRSSRFWWRPRASPPLNREAVAQRSGASVDSYSRFADLPEDAVAALTQAETAYVEAGRDWYALLADSVFASERELCILVLRRQGKVLAVLPTLCGHGPKDTGPGEVSALSNYYTTLYTPALADGLMADDLLPLILALKKANPGAPSYRFAPMDPSSQGFALLRDAMRLAGLRPYAYFAFGNWYLKVEGDWQAYLKARSGQLRSTIKRMSKRLAAEGGHLEILSSEAEVERGIAAYQQVYASSWKVPEPYVNFIPGLIRLCARRGWLRLGIAWIGTQPIAAQLWIVSNGRAHIYKVAYDEAYKAIAPGTLVTAMLIEQAIEQDHAREVDYLIGDDAYKKTWMSHRRERFGLIAYDPRTLRGLAGWLRQSIGDAWRAWRKRTEAAAPSKAHPPSAAPNRADNVGA